MTELSIASSIDLNDFEQELLKNAHANYKTLLIEKEFGGGFSGTHVLLILPIRADGKKDARVVSKIGPPEELLQEQTNYDTIVGDAIPFSAAKIKKYYTNGEWAVVTYDFTGGEALGKTLSLEDYYLAQPAENINSTLNTLLDQTLGEAWYGETNPYHRLFKDEYGHHLLAREELKKIVSAIYPRLVSVDDRHIQIPGVSVTYPDPLSVLSKLLDQTLNGKRSMVHGDLHVRNVLVDATGKGWLIDFAKVKERHNLFDFIKLETYIRLMALGQIAGAFSLSDYARFEESLNNSTLQQPATPPTNPELLKAWQVIQNIRQIAKKYMGHAGTFNTEYFPALFLYAFSMLKYFSVNGPAPTQLMYITACVLGKFITEPDEPTQKSGKPIPEKEEKDATKMEKKKRERFSGININGEASDNIIVNGDHNEIKKTSTRVINTGGGAYFGGNVNVTGDLVGRDKITNQYGPASADDIAEIFKQFLQRVEKMEDGRKKNLTKTAVQDLETEAMKGEQASEKDVNDVFDVLALMAPDIFDVVVSTLASPIKGLSTIIQKIAIHLRDTRKK